MDRELDLRLKEIRNRISQADPLLVQLVQYASSPGFSLQYGVVLILDGITVRGIPGPAVSTGEVLDKQSVRFLRTMQAMDLSTGGDGGFWPGLIHSYEESAPFAAQARINDNARSEIRRKIGDAPITDPKELLGRSDDLAEEAANAFTPPKAFTMVNAQIRPMGETTWESIPNMRVNLSSVRAWWTFDLGVPNEVKDILAQLEGAQHSPEG